MQARTANSPVIQPFWERTEKGIVWNPNPLDEKKYEATGKYHGGICGLFQKPVYRKIKKKDISLREAKALANQLANQEKKKERRQENEVNKQKKENLRLEAEKAKKRIEQEKQAALERQLKEEEWKKTHQKIDQENLDELLEDLLSKASKIRQVNRRDKRLESFAEPISSLHSLSKSAIGGSVEVEIKSYKELRDRAKILLGEEDEELSGNISNISLISEGEVEVGFDYSNSLTWILQPLEFVNGISRGDITQYLDGDTTLGLLERGELRGNVKTTRVPPQANTRMHCHLNQGSAGIAFIYKYKHDGTRDVTPTVYDFAPNRTDNKYRWRKGKTSSGNSDAPTG